MSPRARHLLLGLSVSVVVAGLLIALRGTYVMQALELKTLDARFRALHDPARADTNIVIVDVDNLSLELLRGSLGRFPWRREAWALVVQYAAAGGARAVGFDFTFPERDLDHPASDSAFARAARAAGIVVQTLTFQRITDTAGASGLAAFREDSAALRCLGDFAWPTVGVPPGGSYQAAEHPYLLLLGASRAVGSIDFTPDPVDGALRRVPLFYEFRGRAYPAFGLALAAAADSARFRSGPARFAGRAALLGSLAVPMEDGEVLVNWRGPYRVPGHGARSETYRIYPIAQIIHSYQQARSGERPEVPLEAFRGKIVLVGASGSGLFEARANPFGPSDPGVLIHATLADNLLRGDFLRRATPAANVTATLAAALLAGLAVSLIASASASGVVGAGLAALYLVISFLLFGRANLWLDTASPTLAVLFTFTGGMALNYVTEGRKRRQIREMFSKYVAPEYVAKLAEDPAHLELGGRRAELSILFSDIRGFTSISEKMQPHEVIEFLNEYLSEMAAIVKHSGGTLDKFIGDAVMAFWGEPVHHPDHADRAADCALAMRDATAKLAARWVAEGKPNLRIGIGINTAEVVVGNIGSMEHKLDYTVIGDGVNLASRLEGLNKDHGTTIIISESARARLGDRYQVRPLGEVKVKGKELLVPIFELVGRVIALAILAVVGAAAATAPALAQKAQWTDVVYVPGRWTGGRLVPVATANAQTDTLALLERVDYFASPPRWRAEIRRTTNGQALADQPDVLIGDGARVVVVTALGSTPLEQHALGRDPMARADALVLDAGGRRQGAANGRIAEKGAGGTVTRVVFRRAARSASFDVALLNPGSQSGGRNLLASNIRAVGDQRNASVVATAGARGVDRVSTPGGQVPVVPDSNAVLKMERFSVGAVTLEDFLRRGGLGPYKPAAAAPGP